MKRAHRIAVSFAVAASCLALFTIQGQRSAPLPELAPPQGEWPAASPPPEMALVHIPTGIIHRNAGVAYRGGSFGDKRDFSMSAALVKHPRGDLLIDTGFGDRIDAQFQLMPFWFRAVSDFKRERSAAQQLTAAGYDRTKLRAILLTHAHWDHLSGVPDFPGTPAWITRDEQQFIAKAGWITAVARSCGEASFQTYDFEAKPYLSFERSHDVYGDGSIVVVPAPGHSPGSVIIFVNLPNKQRYAFIGDLAWQQEGIRLREERPLVTRVLADSDAESVRAQLQRMAAIAKRFPDLIIVPAHDSRGFSSMQKL